MKTNIFSLIVLMFFLASCGEKGLKIEGELLNSNFTNISLELIEGAKRTKLDEAKIKNNRFEVSANLESKQVVGLFLDNELIPHKQFDIKEGDLSIVIDCKKVKNEYEKKARSYHLNLKYKQADAKLREALNSHKDEWEWRFSEAKSKNEMDELKKKEVEAKNKLMKDANDYFIELLLANTDTKWALDLFVKRYHSVSRAKGLELLEKFKVNFSDSDVFKFVEAKFAEYIEIDQPAPIFTLKDTEGKDVSLSDFKGKVVILDFWASWCKPCRKENPHMVKLYNKYKGKGLEIIGVSLDNNAVAWEKAINADKLPWINVSSNEGWTCPVARSYGISEVPSIFLIDTKGIVRGKKLRGKKLEDKLKELLKQ